MSTTTLVGAPDPEDPDTTATVLDFRSPTGAPDDSATPRTALEAKVFDAELVEQDGPAGAVGERLPVDPAPRTDDRSVPERLRAALEANRRPVIAPWLRSRQEFTDTARWAVSYAGHVVAFHVVRSPLYAAKLAVRAPYGVARALALTANWVRDAEAAPLRQLAVAREDADLYLKLARQRDENTGGRKLVVFLAALTVAIGVLALLAWAPGWVQWLAALVGIGVFGWIGTPADKNVLGRAVVGHRAPRLTSDSILRALGGLGIAQINQALGKGGTGITFPSPIARDGAGWLAEIDLPPGVTAGEVMERRAKLASGLRRQLGCVWPEGDPTVHEGRLKLWVGDKDMSTAKPARWPLARAGQVDLFKPVPFGTDQRGRWVEVTLMYVSGVLGAIPRMGKTVTLRELGLIAALDPRAELHVYDLKGTGDLSPFEPVAHRYGVGDDPADLEAAVVGMRELREEMRRRAKVIRDLPDDVCPDSRVEPALASNPTLRLHPVMVIVDECQVWFEHDQYGKELEEICTDLVKRGPACGIGLFLATQRPDSKSIPTGISANVSFRFCLKVMGQTENDMVLGTSSYQAGVRATTFAWSDKGIGYLRGEGTNPRIVRSVYTDKPAAKAIVVRARAMREAAGTVTGYAAGQHVDTDAIRGTILDDLGEVFGSGEDRLWSEVLIARLAEVRADYATWSPDTLATALKPYGITPKQVAMRDADGERRNRRGYRLADITRARANRHNRHGG